MEGIIKESKGREKRSDRVKGVMVGGMIMVVMLGV
ncbi:hypothetical protein BDCR2A_02019 [Borrelia duttonii CR2A]|uniref:Uncharacterized protein n=1 Tax=Borrelia duttonii CR2A TaxID=1432657 RepID=W6TVP4_9SPIR|nr:hypothetical protein BDCR2A_02019 [Borrelia duttonii CR2A]